MFVAKIHNNSLGNCIPVDTFEEGEKLLLKLAAEHLNRELTKEEIEDIENEREFHDFSDSDNHTSFSLGMLENE